MLASPGPYATLMLASPGPYETLMLASPGPYVTLMLASPGPYVTLMLTSPGPHAVIVWQAASPSWMVQVVRAVHPTLRVLPTWTDEETGKAGDRGAAVLAALLAGARVIDPELGLDELLQQLWGSLAGTPVEQMAGILHAYLPTSYSRAFLPVRHLTSYSRAFLLIRHLTSYHSAILPSYHPTIPHPYLLLATCLTPTGTPVAQMADMEARALVTAFDLPPLLPSEKEEEEELLVSATDAAETLTSLHMAAPTTSSGKSTKQHEQRQADIMHKLIVKGLMWSFSQSEAALASNRGGWVDAALTPLIRIVPPETAQLVMAELEELQAAEQVRGQGSGFKVRGTRYKVQGPRYEVRGGASGCRAEQVVDGA